MQLAPEWVFLRAIADDPEDDLSRLVYADWLEEHGDPYGEFIRVQVRLNNLEATDPNRLPLESRQSELEEAVGLAGWKRRLDRHGLWVRCRRGFADEIVVDLPACSSPDAGASGHFTAVLTGDMVEPLLSVPSRFTALLSTLGIAGDTDYGSEKVFQLPGGVAAGLLSLPCFSTLNTLGIDGNGTVLLGAETARVVVSHVHLGRLRKLTLDNHRFGAEGCYALAEAARLVNLTSLRLRHTGIDRDGARALAGAACLANLTELDLRDNSIDDEGARALAHSAHLHGLQRLLLHGNSIGPDGAAALKGRFGQACLLPRLQGSERSRPGDWYCRECSASNFSSRDVCYECRSPRPQPRLREGDWLCSGCHAHNFARRQTCHRCKGERPTPPVG